MSFRPGSLSWIAVSMGGLAVSLIFASWVLASYSIGTSVHGYIYGVDSVEKLDLSVSQINETSTDVHSYRSLDLVNNNVSSDLLSPTMSVSLSTDTNIKHIDTISNRQVPFSESTSPKFPRTEELNGSEAFAAAASNLEAPMMPLDNSEDVVNNSLPTHSNAAASLVEAGTDSSNVTSNIRINEPVSGDLINKASMSTASNETSPRLDSTSKAVIAPFGKSNNASNAGSVDSGCDLYHGSWIHDPSGPLYTNNSCPVLTQMQNCQGNGRPDKDYENWRWKPFQCDLPRFEPKNFLELMRGKTLAFIGDSVARNQMESMLCILWQVEVPKNRGNRHMQRFYFRTTSVTIVRIWSSWLVKVTSEPFGFAPAGVDKVHLDVPDEKFMEFIPSFDVVVISSGHWFAKKSVYILNNEIVGGQLWWPKKSKPMKVNNIEAYQISVETILTVLVTHPNYKGLTILRSYSPDHYEGGAWNTGGSCTGKAKPLAVSELVKNGHTDTMHKKQVTGFNHALKKANNRSKLILMDITEAFQYRHDGHPGPYRSPDPNKITKAGPDGKAPPQDCLHWCMPGPVDTWNELVFEIVRREYSRGSTP